MMREQQDRAKLVADARRAAEASTESLGAEGVLLSVLLERLADQIEADGTRIEGA